MPTNKLQFVTVNDLQDAKKKTTRRLVRSSAARHYWAQTAAERSSRKSNKRKADADEAEQGDEKRVASLRGKHRMDATAARQRSPLLSLLSAGRIDPFQMYPGPSHSQFPELIDHYIVYMAVDIPEIDSPGRFGLLRTSWFPFVLMESPTFLVVMLLAASHLFSLQRTPGKAVDLLQLKHAAINSINAAIQREGPGAMTSDWLIGAVAKMASYEAMYGDQDSYRAHMEGLRQMVNLRGGLESLGLDGLLRRIVIWIDTNSGFLNRVPRFFPNCTFEQEQPLLEPNPARFIAV